MGLGEGPAGLAIGIWGRKRIDGRPVEVIVFDGVALEGAGGEIVRVLVGHWVEMRRAGFLYCSYKIESRERTRNQENQRHSYTE